MHSALYENSGRTFTLQELRDTARDQTLANLHKIVENLKFEGTLKKLFFRVSQDAWTLLTKVETSCDRILIAGGANVEAEWEQGPAV